MTSFFADFFPREIVEQMRKNQEMQQMENEAWVNDFRRMLSESSRENLITFKSLLAIVSGSNAPRAASNYYEGIIGGYLDGKFNVCPGCGRDHTEEFLDKLEPRIKTEVQEPESEPELGEEEKELIRNLNEYHVRILHGAKVICTRCNAYTWPSLEDRMLRGKDECPQCIQKAKWG